MTPEQTHLDLDRDRDLDWDRDWDRDCERLPDLDCREPSLERAGEGLADLPDLSDPRLGTL